MAELEVLEGNWEEIVRQQDRLAGHRLRVIVLPSSPDQGHENPLSPDDEERLLDEIADAGRSLPVLPPEANSRAWIYGDHD